MLHLSYKPTPQRCLQKISNCSTPYNIKTFLSSSPTKTQNTSWKETTVFSGKKLGDVHIAGCVRTELGLEFFEA